MIMRLCVRVCVCVKACVEVWWQVYQYTYEGMCVRVGLCGQGWVYIILN